MLLGKKKRLSSDDTGILKNQQVRSVLLVTLHHIAGDGVSLDILLRELDVLYRSHIGESQEKLEALSIQYADYALWQLNFAQGQQLDNELSYWRQRVRRVTWTFTVCLLISLGRTLSLIRSLVSTDVTVVNP